MINKAQGALEYLIIVAAVLAIAAVVVSVLTGALGGGQQSAAVSKMKEDASKCSQALGGQGYIAGTSRAYTQGQSICADICGANNPTGDKSHWQNPTDIATASVPSDAGATSVSTPQDACFAGKPSWIVAK